MPSLTFLVTQITGWGSLGGAHFFSSTLPAMVLSQTQRHLWPRCQSLLALSLSPAERGGLPLSVQLRFFWHGWLLPGHLTGSRAVCLDPVNRDSK